MSREAASHPSDEAGVGRNTLSVLDDAVLAFSAVDSECSDASDDDDDDAGPELLKAI